MIERVCWTVVALIHLPPFAAFFRPALIERLYGMAPGGELFPLLHHRAALFGAVFIACVWAAIDLQAARIASALAAVSMLSFLLVYQLNGQPASLRTIAIADLAGLPFLAWAAWRAWTLPAG